MGGAGVERGKGQAEEARGPGRGAGREGKARPRGMCLRVPTARPSAVEHTAPLQSIAAASDLHERVEARASRAGAGGRGRLWGEGRMEPLLAPTRPVEEGCR